MDILHVDHTSVLGGAERSILELAKAQRPTHRPTIASGSEGRLLEEAVLNGLAARSMRWPSAFAEAPAGSPVVGSLPVLLGLAISARRLSSTIDELRPDIVHVHTRKAQLAASLAAATRAPVVFHLRDAAPRRAALRALIGRAVRRSRHAVALSPWLAEQYRELGMLPHSGVIGIVPSGVEQRGLAALDTPWLDGSASPRIGFIGQIARWKAPHLLIEIAEQLTDEPGATFHIIGDVLFPAAEADYAQWLRHRLASSTAAARVSWHAACSSPEEAFALVDVLVHTSVEPEPFGRVIVEAMASHRPVVAFRHGGPGDILDSGSAFLADAFEARALASAVRAAIGSRRDARTVVAAAARKAAAFVPSRVAEMMDDEYQRAMQ